MCSQHGTVATDISLMSTAVTDVSCYSVTVLCSHINENMTVFVVRLAFAYKMFRICPFFMPLHFDA